MLHKVGASGRRAVIISCIFIIALLNGSCTPSFEGEPRRVYSIDEDVQYIKKTFGRPNFTAYVAMMAGERKVYRNEYVLGQMAAINDNYGKFEADLTREMQSVSFASTVSNIALTTVASQVTPVGTKDILTATAAGLTGVKAAYDKDILLGRTIQIIQNQMRASRAQVATRIIKNLGRSTDEYPLMMAWMDLQDYYRAGTVTNGLVEAEQTISIAAADAAETRAYTVVQGLSTTDSTSIAFFNFIYAGNTNGPPDLKRKKYLDALLSNDRHDSYYYFTDVNAKYDRVRTTLIVCMSSYGGNAPCKPGSIAVP